MTSLNDPVTTIADAMSREYPAPVATPCNECPWRRVAARGWLGPMTADEWLEAVHGETPIACHKTISGDGWEGASQCRGAASFRANVCKAPRNDSVAVGPADRDGVFATSAEFKEHHTT